MNKLKIQVMYHDEQYGQLPRLRMDTRGDWVDLTSAETVEMKAGDFKVISLGISMRLPDGYEAHIATRSSTFKKWGVLMANSHGIIDNSYSGPNDIWRFPALAMRDTVIHKGDAICQFRLVKKMPEVDFEECELTGPDRGAGLMGDGTGMTGTAAVVEVNSTITAGDVLYMAEDNGFGDVKCAHVTNTGNDDVHGSYFQTDTELANVCIPIGWLNTQKYYTDKSVAREKAGLEG